MRDPNIPEKYTRERSAARKLAQEYFERFPKDRYQTEVESWRHLQSANCSLRMSIHDEAVTRANRSCGVTHSSYYLTG
jgi:hypothetical protein